MSKESFGYGLSRLGHVNRTCNQEPVAVSASFTKVAQRAPVNYPSPQKTVQNTSSYSYTSNTAFNRDDCY